MMILKTLFFIQVISFVSYMTFITLKFKLLPSISESWYSLNNNSKVLFTLFIWSLSIPMAFYGQTTVLFFISGIFLSFVGVATMFKTDALTKKVHYIGAAGGIIFGLLALCSQGIYYPIIVTAIGIVPFLIFKQINNKIMWVEIISATMILAGLYSIIFN